MGKNHKILYQNVSTCIKNRKNCYYFLLVAYYLQIFSYLCNVF